MFNFNMQSMTKFVCPIKFNKVVEVDKDTLSTSSIIRIKPDRRYRIDRPKDVTEHLKPGPNSVQIQKAKDDQ
mgnify:CR=1 FL=1